MREVAELHHALRGLHGAALPAQAKSSRNLQANVSPSALEAVNVGHSCASKVNATPKASDPGTTALATTSNTVRFGPNGRISPKSLAAAQAGRVSERNPAASASAMFASSSADTKFASVVLVDRKQSGAPAGRRSASLPYSKETDECSPPFPTGSLQESVPAQPKLSNRHGYLQRQPVDIDPSVLSLPGSPASENSVGVGYGLRF